MVMSGGLLWGLTMNGVGDLVVGKVFSWSRTNLGAGGDSWWSFWVCASVSLIISSGGTSWGELKVVGYDCGRAEMLDTLFVSLATMGPVLSLPRLGGTIGKGSLMVGAVFVRTRVVLMGFVFSVVWVIVFEGVDAE